METSGPRRLLPFLSIVMVFACGDPEPTEALGHNSSALTSGNAHRIPPDSFATRPSAPYYWMRKLAFIQYTLSTPPGSTNSELIRLAYGYPVNESVIRPNLDYIDARNDTADFRLSSVVRLLYEHADNPALSAELRAAAKATALGFKYWPDEPGVDDMASQTENHSILFASAAYLTAQLYPHETFVNSGTLGRDRLEIFRARVLRWTAATGLRLSEV